MTMNHTPPYVRIEAQQLMGDEYDTYFVDVVTTDRNDGHKSTTNLRAVSDIHLARQIARDVAKGISTHVEDNTMTPRDVLSMMAPRAA